MSNLTGTTHWFDLPTSDLLDAMAFYESLFGWRFVQSTDVAESNYVMIRAGETLIGGLRQSEAPKAQAAAHPVLYFTVDRLQPSVARARELGATAAGAAVDLGAGRGHYQLIRDRDRNLIGLWATSL